MYDVVGLDSDHMVVLLELDVLLVMNEVGLFILFGLDGWLLLGIRVVLEASRRVVFCFI
jgi:hypothetical protein